MQLATKTQPRYQIVVWSPRYGSRDEITHSIGQLVDVAYTRRMAERKAGRVDYELEEYTELGIEIIDTRPGELDASRPLFSLWTPEMVTLADEGDIPF